jgi:hypothetical protein
MRASESGYDGVVKTLLKANATIDESNEVKDDVHSSSLRLCAQ